MATSRAARIRIVRGAFSDREIHRRRRPFCPRTGSRATGSNHLPPPSLSRFPSPTKRERKTRAGQEQQHVQFHLARYNWPRLKGALLLFSTASSSFTPPPWALYCNDEDSARIYFFGSRTEAAGMAEVFLFPFIRPCAGNSRAGPPIDFFFFLFRLVSGLGALICAAQVL